MAHECSPLAYVFAPIHPIYAHPLSCLSRLSSNTIACTLSIVSVVVAVAGRRSRGSSSKDVQLRLNSAAHFLKVDMEVAEYL
ncbi:hypothetical protein TNCV_2552671 [Trichonephila clavipes]|nr:hypothetical protein TNCV_2552671 [Trichonephila clavipes]